MTAFSIQDRITGWMADQIGKEDPLDGDDFGYHATMAAMQTPKGDAIIWIILVTLRAPFLGQQPIGATGKLQGNTPSEAAVRQIVTKLVTDLRQEHQRQKTAMIKAPGLGLPGGLSSLPGALKQGPN
jgi:hypothetical protein